MDTPKSTVKRGKRGRPPLGCSVALNTSLDAATAALLARVAADAGVQRAVIVRRGIELAAAEHDQQRALENIYPRGT